MKAISIRQPWLWCITRPDISIPRRTLLLPHVLKDIENRDWFCSYVGPLLLHAAQKVDLEAYDWIRERFPDIPLPRPEELERGGIAGRAIMQGCVDSHPSPWFMGKWGFVLAEQEPLELVPLRGQLGLFDVPGFLTKPKVPA